MNIREEFSLSEIDEALLQDVTTIIIGTHQDDARCKYLMDYFSKSKARIISVFFDHETSRFRIAILNDSIPNEVRPNQNQFTEFLAKQIDGYGKSILVDLTSLQHSVIIMLLNTLCTQIKPAHLFAAYVKPEEYSMRDSLGKYYFSENTSEPSGIPGLIRMRKNNEIVIPFLGFEGDRLRNIIENMEYDTIIPIIGFPSEDPSWQFDSLRNCMQVLDGICPDVEIKKCKSNSIYDAINMLNEIESLYPGRDFVLLPLGIRPHTAACAIWTSKRKNVRLVYDYPVEAANRSKGIGDVIIYHLSRFVLE